MKELSIIISTYKNVEFLKECFDSIINSIKSFNVEVLVGIDACVDSLHYIINNKFPNYFRFVFFEKNQGPYTVFNTLVKESSSKNVLFFGSDDIMCENMVSNLLENLNIDFVKTKYSNFNDGEKKEVKSKVFDYGGIFMIKKELFLSLNGFEPWLCEADTDFIERLKKVNHTESIINSLCFYRRIHPKGLTSNLDTNGNSQLRKKYKKITKTENRDSKLEFLKTHNFVELNKVDESKIDPINENFKEKTIKRNFIKSIIYN